MVLLIFQIGDFGLRIGGKLSPRSWALLTLESSSSIRNSKFAFRNHQDTATPSLFHPVHAGRNIGQHAWKLFLLHIGRAK